MNYTVYKLGEQPCLTIAYLSIAVLLVVAVRLLCTARLWI